MDDLFDIFVNFIEDYNGDEIKKEISRIIEIDPKDDVESSIKLLIEELPWHDTKKILHERITNHYYGKDDERVTMVLNWLYT